MSNPFKIKKANEEIASGETNVDEQGMPAEPEDRDSDFMDKYALQNNLFYTIFTSITEYFKISILSLMFLDGMSNVKFKIIVLYALFFLLNRLINLSHKVMFSTVEIGISLFITLFIYSYSTKFNNIKKDLSIDCEPITLMDRVIESREGTSADNITIPSESVFTTDNQDIMTQPLMEDLDEMSFDSLLEALDTYSSKSYDRNSDDVMHHTADMLHNLMSNKMPWLQGLNDN